MPECSKTVSKEYYDEQLSATLGKQLGAYLLTVGGRACANVDQDIVYTATDAAYQLVLTTQRGLKVAPPQREAWYRERMIGSHKATFYYEFG